VCGHDHRGAPFLLLTAAQVGLPTTDVLKSSVMCVKPVAQVTCVQCELAAAQLTISVQGLVKLVKKPNKAVVVEVIQSLSVCMKSLGKLADSCEGPAVMAITLVPVVGPMVGVACAITSSMVEK